MKKAFASAGRILLALLAIGGAVFAFYEFRAWQEYQRAKEFCERSIGMSHKQIREVVATKSDAEISIDAPLLMRIRFSYLFRCSLSFSSQDSVIKVDVYEVD